MSKSVAFVTTAIQRANIAQFVDKVVILPPCPAVQYPQVLLDALRESTGDFFLFMGPQCPIPAAENIRLAFDQLEKGYQLIVPFRDHKSKVMYYTFLIFGRLDGRVLDIIERWARNVSKWYPWEAFSRALYSFPVKFWPVPSSWWRVETVEGVAVVIPCYDHERYLPDAVKSALDANADQVIVVDDGSTGDVVEALSVFAQKPVYVVQQVNKGLPAARNAGVKAATVSNVVSLDADDMLDKSFVESALLVLDEFSWVYSNVHLFGDTEREININVSMRTMRTMQPAHPAVMFRKMAWRFVGGYDETIGGFESWDFHARMMQGGWSPAKCTGLVHYRKRRGEGMLSKVMRDKQHHLDALASRSPVFFQDAFR